ncbi:hypothetical protein [Nonomuraea sp. JJY05]
MSRPVGSMSGGKSSQAGELGGGFKQGAAADPEFAVVHRDF